MSAFNIWVDRQQAERRLSEITNRVNISDLTDLELLASIAVLEQADQRVNGHTAPVLQLVPRSPYAASE